MNRDDIIRMAIEHTIHGLKFDEDGLIRFADLIASAEREVWERKYARLQSLMDIRETQPNKPCCLAEREACAKVCEDSVEYAGDTLAELIRARGQE